MNKAIARLVDAAQTVGVVKNGTPRMAAAIQSQREAIAPLALLIEAARDRRDTETAVAWGKLSESRIRELCKRYGTESNWTRPAHEAHAQFLAALASVET